MNSFYINPFSFRRRCTRRIISFLKIRPINHDNQTCQQHMTLSHVNVFHYWHFLSIREITNVNEKKHERTVSFIFLFFSVNSVTESDLVTRWSKAKVDSYREETGLLIGSIFNCDIKKWVPGIQSKKMPLNQDVTYVNDQTYQNTQAAANENMNIHVLATENERRQ